MKSRKLLMIPGPIEFENDVLQRMAIPLQATWTQILLLLFRIA